MSGEKETKNMRQYNNSWDENGTDLIYEAVLFQNDVR